MYKLILYFKKYFLISIVYVGWYWLSIFTFSKIAPNEKVGEAIIGWVSCLWLSLLLNIKVASFLIIFLLWFFSLTLNSFFFFSHENEFSLIEEPLYSLWLSLLGAFFIFSPVLFNFILLQISHFIKKAPRQANPRYIKKTKNLV